MTETILKGLIALTALLIGGACLLPAQAQQSTTPPAAPASPAPRAVVPLTSYNFGDIYRGEIISHIFIIRNEGDADLVIKDFAAG